jgi:hypothetical protein
VSEDIVGHKQVSDGLRSPGKREKKRDFLKRNSVSYQPVIRVPGVLWPETSEAKRNVTLYILSDISTLEVEINLMVIKCHEIE